MNIYLKPLLILAAILILNSTYSQSVGIGTTTPDQSAALHISDNNKGILLPRLTTSQRMAIPNPANSLLVFDTDTESFWWRGETAWIELISSNIGLRDTDGDTRVEVEQTVDKDEIVFYTRGEEKGKFLGNQFYVRDKITLGTYAQRGMFTLRGPNDVEFGPTIFMYGNSSDQAQSGRLRFVEGTAAVNWRGAYMHYNGGTNLLHIGRHNTSDNNPANDINAITMKRNNGFVGINNENPQKHLSVNGDVQVDNGGQVLIETGTNAITLQAGTTTITMDATGGVVITSTSGDIDMTASNINITASNDININAGSDYSLITDGSISNTAGTTHSTVSGTGMAIQASTTLDVTAGVGIDLISSGITDIKGSIILLNASSSSNGAARQGDIIAIPPGPGGGSFPIITSSSTVRIGG